MANDDIFVSVMFKSFLCCCIFLYFFHKWSAKFHAPDYSL